MTFKQVLTMTRFPFNGCHGGQRVGVSVLGTPEPPDISGGQPHKPGSCTSRGDSFSRDKVGRNQGRHWMLSSSLYTCTRSCTAPLKCKHPCEHVYKLYTYTRNKTLIMRQIQRKASLLLPNRQLCLLSLLHFKVSVKGPSSSNSLVQGVPKGKDSVYVCS